MTELEPLVIHVTGNDRRWHPQPDADDRATTRDIFDPLHTRFAFTIDVAAAAHNTKCPRYFDVDADGLAQSWAGESVWCNPPFSDLPPWVAKAWAEYPATRGIVMLMPANRSEQGWWQQLIEPYRDRPGSPLTTEFLPGRIRFLRPGQAMIGPGERTPFGCVLLIWHTAPRPALQNTLAGSAPVGNHPSSRPSPRNPSTTNARDAQEGPR